MDKMGDTTGVGEIIYTGSRDDLNRKLRKRDDRITELEAAVLAAKTMLHPTNDATEEIWQILDRAYHGNNSQ